MTNVSSASVLGCVCVSFARAVALASELVSELASLREHSTEMAALKLKNRADFNYQPKRL